MISLNLELITGDVNQITDLDFLLMGHKNPLINRICLETKATFKLMKSESCFFPHHYELLEVPFYKWKKIAAIKFRSNGQLSETQFTRISSPLSTALKQPNTTLFGILPPTWRNPEYCALGVIYSLWVIGYGAESCCQFSYPDIMANFCPNPSYAKFKIISQTGIQYFEEVLKNDCKIMWDFIKKLCQKQPSHFGLDDIDYRKLRKSSVKFNITQSSIP